MEEVKKGKPRAKTQVATELTGEPGVKEQKRPVRENRDMMEAGRPSGPVQQPPAGDSTGNGGGASVKGSGRNSAMNDTGRTFY
jgi:hypothetical protein